MRDDLRMGDCYYWSERENGYFEEVAFLLSPLVTNLSSSCIYTVYCIVHHIYILSLLI